MDTLETLFPYWHWTNLLIIPGLIIGFTIHELGHSLTAYFLGDTSQAQQGKISLNPLKHISWLGTILFLLFGIGWPKPVRFDPEPFKDRYLDSFLVSIAGSVANFAISLLLFGISLFIMFSLNLANQISNQQATAILFFSTSKELLAMNFSEGLQQSQLWIIAFTNRVWVANFMLAFISLIPLPPFDGFTAALSLLGLIRQKRINELLDEKSRLTELLDEKSRLTVAKTPQANNISQPETPSPQLNKKQSITDIHFQVGFEYHQQQKFDDAIARYRQALKNDPSFGPAYINMGLAYKAKNMPNEAIQAFRGAAHQASDEKSKTQAWAELYDLQAIPNAPTSATTNQNSGSEPWTDTTLTPNWVVFLTGITVFLFFFSCVVTLLLYIFVGAN